jgi:D-sedoheptulose 7-phosphate isomerase
MKYLKNYIKQLKLAISSIDYVKLKNIEKIIYSKIINNKKIFICGNGGSASVANHFLCDFNKGVKISSNYKLKPKIISLSNNLELILAIANDISFDKIFTHQLENYYSKGDIVITLSCSGQSSNIIDVLNFCKREKIFTISFTGFATKQVKKKSNINFNINVKNYGISEDFFQIIMHMLSQSIRIKFLSKKKYNNVIL